MGCRRAREEHLRTTDLAKQGHREGLGRAGRQWAKADLTGGRHGVRPGRLVAISSSDRSAASSASSVVRRSEVGSAHCRSSRTSAVGPTAANRATRARIAANVCRCSSSGPIRPGVSWQAHQVRKRQEEAQAAEQAGQRVSQARARIETRRLVERYADPAREQLAVQAIGGRGRVRHAAALKPERAPGASAPTQAMKRLRDSWTRRVLRARLANQLDDLSPPGNCVTQRDVGVRSSAWRPTRRAWPPRRGLRSATVASSCPGRRRPTAWCRQRALPLRLPPS